MKILYVDDDLIARRNMECKIDWQKYDWELVFSAKNGMEALEYIKNNTLDLVLSDIKMPAMDGIQMAEIAMEYNPDINFVFLSGYKDFVYAKKALQLNAIDYIEKPAEKKELIDVLFKAEQIIGKKRNANNILNEKYPIIKHHYITRLISNGFLEVDNQDIQVLDSLLKTGMGTVAFARFEQGSTQSKNEFTAELYRLCQGLSKLYHESFFMPTLDGGLFILFIISDVKAEEQFIKIRSKFESEIFLFSNEYLKAGPLFHYGPVFIHSSQISDSYQQALRESKSQTGRILMQIKRYVELNYSNAELSLNKIAKRFNINNCYLTSIYKETFGLNLYDYLIQVRMENAAKLLLQSNLLSYQISEQVGYHNPQYFSISFKKYFGCTPTEYKSKNNNLLP